MKNKSPILEGVEKYRECSEPTCHKGVVILPMMNRNRGIKMRHIPCNGTGEIVEDIRFDECDFWIMKYSSMSYEKGDKLWDLKPHLKDWKIRSVK